MQQIIHENEINHELTQKIRKDPKYDVFKNWLKANGVLWKDIDFPVAFGPTGVVGVAAARDIPACSGIAAIPNQLLITTTKVREGELSKFIEENPELFKHDSDADFNLLSVFLFREKIKGKESFYFPMIDVLDKSTILLHWKQDEIKELDDPYILKEATELEHEMDRTWEEFRKVFERYTDLFPPSKTSREDFFWCYENVMTRCFGWSLPSTMLVPLADFLNHNADGTTHYMVNKDFEKDEDEAPETYVMKKRKIDLGVFDDEDLLLEEEEKDKYHAPASEIIDYIKKNIEYLSKESKEKLDGGDYDKQDQRRMLREVNFNILVKEKNRQVWELDWFESSDEEDNDTEEEDNDVPESGKGVFDATHKEELEKIKSDQKVEVGQAEKKFQDEEVKQNKTPTKPKNVVSRGTEEKGGEGDDENEDKEEEEDDEVARTEKDKYKYGKGMINEKFSPNKYFRHHVSSYEKKEVDKIKKTSSPSPKKEVQEQSPEKEKQENPDEVEEEEEEEEDDSDWTWFEDSDKNNYFVVSTHSHLSYEKGEQIFNCYGRRSNRFLLMWYGFCVQNNRYNSMSFRLWMNKSSLSGSNPPKRILFQDYITGQEWEDRAVGGEKSANPEELTKEFRIKTSRLCEDILAYLRAKLILAYRGPDLHKILVTIPSSIPYEEHVIDYAITLFSEILNQYRTTIAQDEEILKDSNLDWKKRFAVVYRLEQKKAAHLQLKLLKLLVRILNNVKVGSPLKDSYMEYLPEIDESEEDFVENRRRIANYLKLFYEAPK